MSEATGSIKIEFEDDAIEVASIEQAYEKFVHAFCDHGEIHVDLQNVEQIDTSAIQLFLAAKKEAETHGKSIQFDVSESVTKKLQSSDAWKDLAGTVLEQADA